MSMNSYLKMFSPRRLRLTNRLRTMRERIILLEDELSKHTSQHYRVCIFGSARTKPDDDYYRMTYRLAYLLGEKGLDVLTGGGPGLMQAGNSGVQDGRDAAGTQSISYGLSIELGALGKLERPSQHLDIKHHHNRFSSRLDDFMRLSNAVVVTPGGIGTLLELYFAWQLLQVQHLPARPIILLHEDFWRGIIDWMKETQLEQGLVSEEDFRFLHFAKTPEEAMEIVSADFEEFSSKSA